MTSLNEYIESPPIEPVAEGVHRPCWSVMIPTYNRTKYLSQTLTSVLKQDLGPDTMQIEVIDNCSTSPDIKAEISSNNRVSFYRQPYNVGSVANFTTCIQRARGHLVHILHDDDVVLPGFYSHLQQAFENEPTIGAAFCRHAYIDESNHQRYLTVLERSTPGILPNWLPRIAVRQLIQPPAIVVRRSVYEKLGGFHPQLSHAVDWEMWKRIAAHYPVWYEPQTLAYYREHSSSDTSNLVKSGLNLIDIRRAIEISRAYLPNATADELSSKALEYCTLLNAFKTARRALTRGDTATTIVQIQGALKCGFSLKVIGALALLPILADSVKQYVRSSPKWL